MEGDLVAKLLFVGLGLVEFLAGSQCVAVDGGDESKGDSVDGLIDIRVCAKEYFRGVWGDWGKLLLGFLVSNGEVK